MGVGVGGVKPKRITSTKDEATVVPSLLYYQRRELGQIFNDPHWPPSHSFKDSFPSLQANGLQLLQLYVIAHLFCFRVCFYYFFFFFFGDRCRWDEMASTPPRVGGHAPYQRVCEWCRVVKFQYRSYRKVYSYLSYAKELKRGKSVIRTAQPRKIAEASRRKSTHDN